MTEYAPGTVAVATVRGVPNVRVMRTNGTHEGDGSWLSAVHVAGWRSHMSSDVTEVCRLIVLDMSAAPTYWRDAIDLLRKHHFGAIAGEIEAQTQPPRIPEPEWGKRVVASTAVTRKRRLFVHAYEGVEEGIWTDAAGEATEWSALLDPVLIEDES